MTTLPQTLDEFERAIDRAYARGRADALEEAAQMAEIDARAISKGTHGRMGSTQAIGDHIALAIRAIASIEAAGNGPTKVTHEVPK